jgi:hypothetical protein
MTEKREQSGVLAESPDTKVVPLSRPLLDQEGKEYTSLTLKVPSGAAFVRIGDPFHIIMVDGKTQGFEQNRDRLLSYVAEVTGIHRPLLLAMPIADMKKVTDEMFGFFD